MPERDDDQADGSDADAEKLVARGPFAQEGRISGGIECSHYEDPDLVVQQLPWGTSSRQAGPAVASSPIAGSTPSRHGCRRHHRGRGIECVATHLRDARNGNPNTVTMAAGDIVGVSPLLSAALHADPRSRR